MIHCIRAAQAITMQPGKHPVADFAMIHDGRRILETGTWSLLKHTFSGKVTDLGEVTLVPGLINAHTHLELSHMAGRTVQQQGFLKWVQSLLNAPPGFDPEAVRAALESMKAGGTCFCGDIATYNCVAVAAIMEESNMGFTAWCEAIGTRIPAQGARFFPQKTYTMGRTAGAGHALYSTGAELLQAVQKADQTAGLPFSIHLAENQEEEDIVARGTGEFAQMLAKAGMLADCGSKGRSPVEHAHALGLLDDGTLAVHCVRVSDTDIATLAASGTHVCLCPRSNDFIGEGRAPWEKIMHSGINTCLGTDSIASNHDLDLWNELEFFLRNLRSSLTPPQALALITSNSAKALKIDAAYGSLEKGKRACFAVVPTHMENLFS